MADTVPFRGDLSLAGAHQSQRPTLPTLAMTSVTVKVYCCRQGLQGELSPVW